MRPENFFSANLGRYVSVTFRNLNAVLGRRLAPFGIGSGQLPYLFTLFHTEGVTQAELAERHRTDKGGVARSIDRLVQAGLVRREPDPIDRRSSRLYLTGHARELQEPFEQISRDCLDSLTAALSREEVAVVTAAMAKIADAARGLYDEEVARQHP